MDMSKHKASSTTAADSNLFHHSTCGTKPTLPKSNRQYVSPLMLAKGRGKRLNELHSSKIQTQSKSNIGSGSNLGLKPIIGADNSVFKSIGGYTSHSYDLSKKSDSSLLRNDSRSSFNPPCNPPTIETTLEDMILSHEPNYEDSDGDNDFHSSPEDEDMDVDEDNENPHGSDNEDVCDNVLENDYENADDNEYENHSKNVYEDIDENIGEIPIEEPTTKEPVTNADSSVKKKLTITRKGEETSVKKLQGLSQVRS